MELLIFLAVMIVFVFLGAAGIGTKNIGLMTIASSILILLGLLFITEGIDYTTGHNRTVEQFREAIGVGNNTSHAWLDINETLTHTKSSYSYWPFGIFMIFGGIMLFFIGAVSYVLERNKS